MAKVIINIPNSSIVPHNQLSGLQGLGPEYIHLNGVEYDILSSLTNTILIQIGSIEQNDLLITLENVLWRINNVNYSVVTKDFNITPATDGYYRIDIIVGNNLGQLVLVEGVESQINPTEPALPVNSVLVTRINVFGDTISIPPDAEIPTLQQVLDSGSIGIVNKPISIINADFDTGNILGVESFPNDALILYKQSSAGSAGLEFRLGQPGITVYDQENYIGLQGATYYGDNATDNTYIQKKYVDDAIIGATGWKSPQDYGYTEGRDINLNTTSFNECLLENKRVFLYGEYEVNSTLLGQEDQFIFPYNATIKRLSDTEDILFFNNVNNFSMVGNLTIEGNGKSNNTAVGLHIEKGDNFKIEGLTVKNISGKGVYFTGESINRGNRGVLSNVSLQNNWIGAGWQALAEYSTLKNVNAQGNSIGLEILAGNVGIIGGSITDNDNGIYLGGAYATNNSHGIFQGLNVNHNTGYDLKAENVQYGQTITGCHFYGTSSEGGVQLVNSYGVMFNGCILDGILSNTDSNTPKGFNVLNACQLEPEFTLSGDPVLLRNCFIKNAGLSPLNNYDAYGNNEVLASGYDDFGNMSVRTLDNFGAGVGGTLSFAGSAGGSIQFDAAFGKIKGYKLDSSSGFIDGVLAFGTSNNSIAPYFNYHMYLNHLGNLLLGNSTDSGSGAKLQVNGRTSGSDGLNNQDYVTLGQLNTAARIKTTSSTISNTIVVPATATSYRLNTGVTSVTLPVLTGNAGIILFFINNTISTIAINSNAGANDIWSGGASVNTESIPQGTAVRMIHDGTQWVLL